MKKISVLIDIDSGVKNALAVLLASSISRLHILGLSVVNGKSDIDNTYRNICIIADYLGLSIPVSKGSDRPIVKTENTDVHFYKEQMLSFNTGVPESSMSRADNIFQQYDELISGSKEPVKIIALGPLTNIATVLSCLPHLKSNISDICVLGGAIEQGDVTAAAEFNIWHDPEAAAMVIHSGVPITVAPLDVTNQAMISNEEIQLVTSGTGSKARSFLQALEKYSNSYNQKINTTFPPLHDLVPVMWASYPELFTFDMSFVTVDTGNSETRGATLIDHYDTLKQKPNARILESINRDKLISCIHEALCFLGE